MVVAHVDELCGFGDGAVGSFADGFGVAYECHYGSVGRFTGVGIEPLHAFDAIYFGNDLFDDRHIASFRKIGHALY